MGLVKCTMFCSVLCDVPIGTEEETAQLIHEAFMDKDYRVEILSAEITDMEPQSCEFVKEPCNGYA